MLANEDVDGDFDLFNNDSDGDLTPDFATSRVIVLFVVKSM